MTVEELIEELKNYPLDKDILMIVSSYKRENNSAFYAEDGVRKIYHRPDDKIVLSNLKDWQWESKKHHIIVYMTR